MEKFSRGIYFLEFQIFFLCGGSHVESSFLPKFVFFSVWTKEHNTCAFFVRMLGYVFVRQLAVILRVSAW